MQEYIKINQADNVAVALRDFNKGEIVSLDNEITLSDDIARGHKFALKDIKADEPVIKYGFPIGYAKEDIKTGSHIHVHNLRTGLGDDLTYNYNKSNPVNIPCNLDEEKKYFMGYERKDGKAGVRNELWVIPTVGCVNSIAKEIAAKCQDLVSDNIEAVVSFAHPYGCSQMGDDQENTRAALAGLINHPNAGGVLVLGLGCENSNIEVLKPYIGEFDPKRVRFLQCQDVDDEVSEGVKLLTELSEEASKIKRSKISVEKLVIGMKCGGSDGLSGITANPVVGKLSDIVTSAKGSTILTEVPEMFGAETILMDRCVNKEVFDKTVNLINSFKDYFRRHNQTIYENPSPGNKKGGISSLEDKALGCTQKSGSSEVMDVLEYAQVVKKAGLNLLSAPGNDLVASTALAISGAQIVLFTTGRGTPFASAVPTVKIASNSQLAKKKSNWIDFDAGRLLEDNMNLDILGNELYDYVLDVASGKKVKSEEDGFRDLAIFKQGVTL
ncbi:MAG: altronate dehydratase family protein [Lachnospiraceae bacterium]|nr:altronate dehydratase family protein [Lachnospiraceae bacterium]